MATVRCVLGYKRIPTHEWNDGEKERIYCRGYINCKTEELLPECVNCPDCVIHAQDDLDRWLIEAEEHEDA